MRRVNVVMTYEDVVIKFTSEMYVVSKLVKAIEGGLGACRNFQLSNACSDEVKNE